MSPVIALCLGAALLVAPAASLSAAVAVPVGAIIDIPVTQVLDAAVGADGTTYAAGGLERHGLATGLDSEAILAPWIRFPGQSGYAQGSARMTPDTTGAFTWQRKTVTCHNCEVDSRV